MQAATGKIKVAIPAADEGNSESLGLLRQGFAHDEIDGQRNDAEQENHQSPEGSAHSSPVCVLAYNNSADGAKQNNGEPDSLFAHCRRTLCILNIAATPPTTGAGF